MWYTYYYYLHVTLILVEFRELKQNFEPANSSIYWQCVLV